MPVSSMNRRDFLRRASLVAAGAVAADQIEILDRLGWKRRFFSGIGIGAPTLYGDGTHDDHPALQALFDGRQVYSAHSRRIIGGVASVTLPTAWHKVSRTIELRKSNIAIDFSGSHLEFTRPVDACLRLRQGDHMRVEGLFFVEGGRAIQPKGATSG